MAQKRSGASSSRSKTTAKAKPAAAKAKPASRAKSATRAKSTSGAKPARAKSASSRSAASRKAAASKGGKATARKRTATKAASETAKTAARGARSAGVEAKTVAELREALRKNLIGPLEMVMISRERIEEVLGEAVDQGRVTVRDAQRITSGLVKRGQRQTSDVLKDLENLLDRGGAGSRLAPRLPAAAPCGAPPRRWRRSTACAAAPAWAPSFPITGYDDLTATQIQSRLSGLTPAELRKVRDHERRNAGRKTVLAGDRVEAQLARRR